MAAELRKRNPGVDGKVEAHVSDGRVVLLQLRTDAVTDIARVQALTGSSRWRVPRRTC